MFSQLAELIHSVSIHGTHPAPEFAGRTTQYASIPPPAWVVDPSQGSSASSCRVGNCLHLHRQTPKHSVIRQQLQNTTVVQPWCAGGWRWWSLESRYCQLSMWAWTSYTHRKHRPRDKTKDNTLHLSSWQWTPLRKTSEKLKYLGTLKHRSNVYVCYAKNTHGVHSL